MSLLAAYPPKPRKVSTARVALVLAGLMLTGCATSPPAGPKEQQLAKLTTPLYLEVQDRPAGGQTSFVEVRGVKIYYPKGVALPTGQLWLYGMKGWAKHRVPLESLLEFGPGGDGDHPITARTREGRTIELDTANVAWCPNQVAVWDSPNACYAPAGLFGVAAPMSGDDRLAGNPTYLPQYSQGFPGVRTVFTDAQGQSERARIVAVNERNRVAAELNRPAEEAKRAAAEREAKEKSEAWHKAEQEKWDAFNRARAARLAQVPAGTQDFCNTGTMLLKRGEIVAPGRTLYCSVLGQVSLGLLRANGWDVQMTGRTTIQGITGLGDTVEFAATKRAAPPVSPPASSVPPIKGKKEKRS